MANFDLLFAYRHFFFNNTKLALDFLSFSSLLFDIFIFLMQQRCKLSYNFHGLLNPWWLSLFFCHLVDADSFKETRLHHDMIHNPRDCLMKRCILFLKSFRVIWLALHSHVLTTTFFVNSFTKFFLEFEVVFSKLIVFFLYLEMMLNFLTGILVTYKLIVFSLSHLQLFFKSAFLFRVELECFDHFLSLHLPLCKFLFSLLYFIHNLCIFFFKRLIFILVVINLHVFKLE